MCTYIYTYTHKSVYQCVCASVSQSLRTQKLKRCHGSHGQKLLNGFQEFGALFGRPCETDHSILESDIWGPSCPNKG